MHRERERCGADNSTTNHKSVRLAKRYNRGVLGLVENTALMTSFWSLFTEALDRVRRKSQTIFSANPVYPAKPAFPDWDLYSTYKYHRNITGRYDCDVIFTQPRGFVPRTVGLKGGGNNYKVFGVIVLYLPFDVI